MSDAQDRPANVKSRKSRKRVFVYGLVGCGALVAAAYYHLRPSDTDDGTDTEPTHAVFHVRRKAEPPKLAIEYHFDRNAVADSQMVAGQLFALTTSGNLVVFDRDSFAARNERVLRRRATCLGPAQGDHVLVGIANGTIVRASVQEDLVFEVAGKVPGIPRWIGRRSKGGGLVVAYQTERRADSHLWVTDQGQDRSHDVGVRPVLYLDSKDRLWIASAEKVRAIELGTAVQKEYQLKSAWSKVRGFVELGDGQIWAFGGSDGPAVGTGFVVRLSSDGKVTPVYGESGKRRSLWEPSSAITHIVEDRAANRVLVVSGSNVVVTDKALSSWRALDAMSSQVTEPDAFLARGRAHLSGSGVLLNLVRGGIMEITADFARRHVLGGQNPVSRPSEIVRLADGMAIYGEGGPSFFSRGAWRPLPDPIMPPAELVGVGRPGEQDRSWVATTTIPVEGLVSYVLSKAGPPRRYSGHIHGLRDVVLTARWDGTVLSVLGREDLPIEPDDTFITPDKQLWNVDDQALWSFSGGRWRTVMRLGREATDAHKKAGRIDSVSARAGMAFRSAIGEPLHFAQSPAPPFYGLPRNSASWSLVRLDSNEAGGVPLIDEIPIKLEGRRALLLDVATWGSTKDQLLLATHRGLCAFNMKFGNCDVKRPEGLTDEVSMFMRDGTKRLWLAGRGLGVLRETKQLDAVHPFIPMLADTQVVAMAETPEGRLVIGTADRGTIFLTIPVGWFQNLPAQPSGLDAWDATSPHEPLWNDRSVVLQPCQAQESRISDAAMGDIVAALRELCRKLGGRARVELEDQFEGRPDVALRGVDQGQALAAIAPLLEKPAFKGKFSLQKRFGPPGSESVEVAACR